MPDKIINLQIDLNKLDPSKLFKSQKVGTNGKAPLYLNATLLYNEAKDQYENNGVIVQDVSKEDRAAGVKGAILGNGKTFVPAPPVAATAEDLPDYLTEAEAKKPLPF